MTSKANNENFNIVNVSKKSNKENIQKINPIEGQIKVKLNSKISQVKKGLKLIDPNNNCEKNPRDCNKKENKEENKVENKEEKKEENKLLITGLNKRNVNLFLNRRESDHLLEKYGEESYFFNKLLEKTVFNIPETFLLNHKITSIVRTRMIDWMIEVCSVFYFMDETFFLSVNILDKFLQKAKKIYNNTDIHLIGITSMFTASKFQEIYPQTLKNFVHKVAHDMFTVDQIKTMENIIITDIGTEVLVSTSIYDFLKTYFYDFFYNNKIIVEKNCDIKVYKDITLIAKYLSKLIVHYEYFYLYENSMKAIGCIITAIKLMDHYMKDQLDENDRNVYNQWILFLIEQDRIDKKDMENLVNKIYLAFSHYQKSKSISKNLNKFMKLPIIELLKKGNANEKK